MSTAAPYVVSTLTLAANVPRVIRGKTEFVALISASVSLTALEVSLGESDSWQPFYLGVAVVDLVGIDKVAVRSTVGQVVKLATGSAMVYDSRSAPSGGNLALDIVDVGGAGIGQKAMVGSVPVVIANNQSAVPVAGTAAHSAAATGSPVRVGGKVATAAETTLVAGDAADAQVATGGQAVVLPFSVPEATWNYAAAAAGILNSNVAVTIKAAAAAGLRNYLTGMEFVHEALGVATEVAIRDGAAGAVLWRTFIPAGVFGRVAITFPTPLKGTAATLLEVVTLTASGTGSVYVNATGYIAP